MHLNTLVVSLVISPRPHRVCVETMGTNDKGGANIHYGGKPKHKTGNVGNINLHSVYLQYAVKCMTCSCNSELGTCTKGIYNVVYISVKGESENLRVQVE